MTEPISFSHSRRITFDTCKRKYYYQYIAKLPTIDGAGRRAGKAYSTCLEHWSKAPLDAYYDDAILDLHQQREEAQTVEEFKELTDSIGKCRGERQMVAALFDGYVATFGKPLGREWEFTVPYPGTDLLVDRGFVDGFDQFGIIEDKLFEAMFFNPKALPLDPQISAYIRARQLSGFGLQPCRYRVTVKPGIRRKTASGESPKQYYARLREDIAKRPHHYYREFTETRSQDQVNLFEQELARLGGTFLGALEHYENTGSVEQAFPRSTHQCGQYGGCPFIDFCSGKKRENDKQGE